MRYPLAARFRGTLMGAIAGYFAATHPPKSASSPLSPELNPLDQAAIKGFLTALRSLAQGSGQLAWEDVAVYLEPLAATDRTLGFTIASLPVALFYHDAGDEFLPELQKAASSCGLHPTDEIVAQILALTIDLGLHDELHPPTLPAQLLAEFPHLPQDAVATRQLQHLQTALDQRWSCAIALQTLPSAGTLPRLPHALCTALFLLATSPRAPRLLLRRTQQTDASPFTALLTGALVGSYAGTAVFQAELEDALPHHPHWLSQTWHLNHLEEGNSLMEQLLARWAGLYKPTRPPGYSLDYTAIAPPNLLHHSRLKHLPR